MKKVSKAKRKEFHDTVTGALIALQAEESVLDFAVDQRTWVLRTKFGPLRCTMVDTKVYTLLCQFEFPKYASQVVDCNAVSGKWNFIGAREGDPQVQAHLAINRFFRVL